MSQVEELCAEIAPSIDEFLQDKTGRRIGILLCLFEFGRDDGTPVAYVSNAKVDDMASVLDDLRERFKNNARVVSLPTTRSRK